MAHDRTGSIVEHDVHEPTASNGELKLIRTNLNKDDGEFWTATIVGRPSNRWPQFKEHE
jgi:hypothetical protein